LKAKLIITFAKFLLLSHYMTLLVWLPDGVDGVENWCCHGGPNAWPPNSLGLSLPNFLFGFMSRTVCMINTQDTLKIWQKRVLLHSNISYKNL
jgi:hypothetical protein